jgi:hypothetical protein
LHAGCSEHLYACSCALSGSFDAVVVELSPPMLRFNVPTLSLSETFDIIFNGSPIPAILVLVVDFFWIVLMALAMLRSNGNRHRVDPIPETIRT